VGSDEGHREVNDEAEQLEAAMRVKVLRYPERFGEELRPIEGKEGTVIGEMPFLLVAIPGMGAFWVAANNTQVIEEAPPEGEERTWTRGS
jgi:hypothetical protein